MGSRKPATGLRGSSMPELATIPNRAGTDAIRSLGELRKANEALHNVIDGLGRSDDMGLFLEKVLIEALRAAGTENGAVILIENATETGQELAHHVVIQTRGEILSSASKREHGMERVPYTDTVRTWALQLANCEGTVFSKPDDDIYPPAYRDYLHELGVETIHTVALRVGGRMIGWFGVGYSANYELNDDGFALLRLLADQMTIAIELVRMGENTKQAAIVREKALAAQARTEQLDRANKALRGAIDVLASELGVDAMLGETLSSMCRNLVGDAGFGALWMMDLGRDGATLHSVYVDGSVSRPPLPPSALFGGAHPIPHDLFWQKYVEHQPRVCILERSAIASWRQADRMIAFPVFLAGMPVGAFTLWTADSGFDPSEDDIHLGKALAQQATLALQLTSLADEARKVAIERAKKEAAHLRVEELVKANRAIKTSLDLASDATAMNDTLSRILPVVSEQIDCTSASLCIRAEGSTKFFVKLIYSDAKVTIPGSRRDSVLHWSIPDEQLTIALISEQKPVVMTTKRDSKIVLKDGDATADIVGTALGVPLLQRGAVIGCFNFHFPGQPSFSAEQLELLQTLAHQATLVLQLERQAKFAQKKSQRAATLAERARIARDLHDTLAQGLTGILMHLQASQRTTDVGQARHHSGEALNVARGALIDARRAVYALRSIASDRLDFLSALRSVLRTTFAGSGIATEVKGDGDLGCVPEFVETELLRITQEAATNTLKHARASRFDARIVQIDKSIQIDLRDDGVGFDVDIEPDGFGLTGIHERASRIGAKLTLTSKGGNGTEISIHYPLPKTSPLNN